MKKQIRISLLLVTVVFGISAAASGVRAQQITGGYGDASVTDNEVKKAAAFAIRTQSQKTGRLVKLVKIEKAEVQVVAGLNYRVCMSVREGVKKPHTVTVVVYKDLKRKRSLSRWYDEGCKEI